jgi:hypothetical protein
MGFHVKAVKRQSRDLEFFNRDRDQIGSSGRGGGQALPRIHNPRREHIQTKGSWNLDFVKSHIDINGVVCL